MSRSLVRAFLGLGVTVLLVSACSEAVVPGNVALFDGGSFGDGERFGPGTIRIGAECVTFETFGFQPMTLGWPEDSVSWDPDVGAIVFDSVEIVDGTLGWVGGVVLEADGEWIVPPSEACPDLVLRVSDVVRRSLR